MRMSKRIALITAHSFSTNAVINTVSGLKLGSTTQGVPFGTLDGTVLLVRSKHTHTLSTQKEGDLTGFLGCISVQCNLQILI